MTSASNSRPRPHAGCGLAPRADVTTYAETNSRAPASVVRARGVSVSSGPDRIRVPVPDRTGPDRSVSARPARFAARARASRAAGGAPRGSAVDEAVRFGACRRMSRPEMLLPVLVPVLWLWSWTGAAPSGTAQLDSVVSPTSDTFQGSLSRTEGMTGNLSIRSSDVRHQSSALEER